MALKDRPPIVRSKDFGTEVRIKRGDLVREFRDDPGVLPLRRLVRGARVRDSLQTMFKAGHISRDQWRAAEQMRDEMALAGGARPEALESSGIRCSNSTGRWPEDVQLDCLARCRRLWRLLEAAGLESIVDWTVVGGRTLDDWAKEKKCRRESARILLLRGLDLLHRFYTVDEAAP